MTVTIVGSQYGDEGKGGAVDLTAVGVGPGREETVVVTDPWE